MLIYFKLWIPCKPMHLHWILTFMFVNLTTLKAYYIKCIKISVQVYCFLIFTCKKKSYSYDPVRNHLVVSLLFWTCDIMCYFLNNCCFDTSHSSMIFANIFVCRLLFDSLTWCKRLKFKCFNILFSVFMLNYDYVGLELAIVFYVVLSLQIHW